VLTAKLNFRLGINLCSLQVCLLPNFIFTFQLIDLIYRRRKNLSSCDRELDLDNYDAEYLDQRSFCILHVSYGHTFIQTKHT